MLIFKVLACDYDGTLASEDRLGPEVLGALRKAREVGLRRRWFAQRASFPPEAPSMFTFFPSSKMLSAPAAIRARATRSGIRSPSYSMIFVPHGISSAAKRPSP